MTFRSPVARLAVAATALGILGPAVRPAFAQEVLTGTVSVVRPKVVRVVLDGDLAPAVGDSATLTTEVPGVGEVRIVGSWRVLQVESDGIWLTAEAGAVTPPRGSRARIFASNPRRGPPAPVREPTGEPFLLRETFEEEAVFPTTDEPCASRYRDGTFRFMNHGDRDRSCRYVFTQAGALEGTVRVSARFRAVANPEAQSFGLVFGFRDGDYGVFQIDEGGSYKVARLQGGTWSEPRGWTRTGALRTGPGADNELEVEVSPYGVRLWANGQDLGRVDLPGHRAGEVGLYLNQTGMEIAVDDLRILQVAPPTARPLASEGAVLTHLDFQGGAEELNADTDTCRNTVQDGVYRVANVSAGARACQWMFFASVPRVEGPARLSARVRLVEGPPSEPVGLIFGIADREGREFYVFEVDRWGRYKLVRRTPDGWVDLVPWIRRGEVLPGQDVDNELAVELYGRTAHLYVNGGFLRSVELPGPGTGHVGLYVDEPGAVALFDDFRLVTIAGSGPGGR